MVGMRERKRREKERESKGVYQSAAARAKVTKEPIHRTSAAETPFKQTKKKITVRPTGTPASQARDITTETKKEAMMRGMERADPAKEAIREEQIMMAEAELTAGEQEAFIAGLEQLPPSPIQAEQARQEVREEQPGLIERTSGLLDAGLGAGPMQRAAEARGGELALFQLSGLGAAGTAAGIGGVLSKLTSPFLKAAGIVGTGVGALSLFTNLGVREVRSFILGYNEAQELQSVISTTGQRASNIKDQVETGLLTKSQGISHLRSLQRDLTILSDKLDDAAAKDPSLRVTGQYLDALQDIEDTKDLIRIAQQQVLISDPQFNEIEARRIIKELEKLNRR